MPSGAEELVCPSCGQSHRPEERFCTRCGMPLVLPGGSSTAAARDETHERVRKIRPEYAEGSLVMVAGARHQAEAEMIQGLLLEEGVPSVLKRTAGFDVPDFLAAGPRDVLVPETGAELARELLATTEPTPAESSRRPADRPRAAWIAAAVLGGGTAAAVVAWALLHVAG